MKRILFGLGLLALCIAAFSIHSSSLPTITDPATLDRTAKHQPSRDFGHGPSVPSALAQERNDQPSTQPLSRRADVSEDRNRDSPLDPQLLQRMEAQRENIISRLGMSAPLDADETTDHTTGIDAIQELQETGFIIPATIEEVESALRAAAETPDPEDDQAALILKHRGSYRFFLQP